MALVAVLSALGTACGTHARASRSTEPSTARRAPSVATAAAASHLLDAQRLAVTGAPGQGAGQAVTLAAALAPDAPGADWVVVGTVEGASGSTATVWTSDATDPGPADWSAAALPGTDARALAATQDGSSTIVVGSEGPLASARAAVWISAGAGLPFEAVADQPSFAAATSGRSSSRSSAAQGAAAGSALMDVVGAGTVGIFAAGAASGHVAFWYSSDGRTWSRLSRAEAVVGDAVAAQVRALVVTSDGVVAVGSTTSGTVRAGAVWSSADGIHWGQVATGFGPFVGGGDHALTGVAEDGTALVAVGGVRTGRSWIPASWVSPNGSSWTEPVSDLPTAARPQSSVGGTVVRAVAAAGAAGLVAVGGSSTAQRLWSSTDGRSWTETALPAAAADATDWSADLVAGTGTTTLVADGASGDPHVLVDEDGRWSDDSTAFGTPQPSGRVAVLLHTSNADLAAVDVTRPGVTLGTSSGEVAWLASADGGRTWALQPTGAIAGATVTAAIATDSGVVAGGATLSSTGAPAGRAAVWTGTSGSGPWTETLLPGGPGTTVDGLTEGAAGLVAAGTELTPAGVEAAVWRMTGGTWGGAQPLDAAPSIGDETVGGACASGSTVLVVGSATRGGVPTLGAARPASTTTSSTTSTTVVSQGSPDGAGGQSDVGSIAVVWRSSDGGATWTDASVSPSSGVGAAAAMTGCATTGSSWLAWGQAPAGGEGAAQPALWTSVDEGASWSVPGTKGLQVAGPAALTGLDPTAGTWVAVAGDQASNDATVLPPDPFDPQDRSGFGAVAATAPTGAAALWLGPDHGTTWVRQATTGAAWAADAQVEAGAVLVDGDTVVIGGGVDGDAALWGAVLPAGA